MIGMKIKSERKKTALEMETRIHDDSRSHELISYLKLPNFDQSIKRFMKNHQTNVETCTITHTHSHS